ncbi:MAG: hypothetical protein AUJ92_13520 [Armatimonadetes bacterium CG2_30_59_28]|nr:MAG: hypothetical protein AUJ92_13520 [Armatimonadetes bacterium CG2_30_59_28]
MPRAPAPKPQPLLRMTEDEFVDWCDEDVRAEWVGGSVAIMSPDSFEHADLGLDLAAVLRLFVQAKDLGVVVGPNFQIRISNSRRRVPDLLFINKDRLDILQKNHVEGAPDAVFEIVSPDSVERDWREKFIEYEAAGVPEYWVLDPANQQTRQYRPDSHGSYQTIDAENGVHRSEVIPGFYLRDKDLWGTPRVSGIKWLKQLGVK